jgi:hypothetical protein
MKALYFALGLRVIGAAVFLFNTKIFQQRLIGVFAPFALGGLNKAVVSQAGLRDPKACDGLSEAINNHV